MNLIRLCIARPVGVAVGVLLILLFGLLALSRMPVQLTPTVDTPVISIGTQWLGANPQEVEREIIERQEEQLRGVKGLQKMTSTAADSSGSIRLEFYPDINKSDALQDVIDKLNRVGGYPLDMDEPTVAVADNARDSEIAWLLLRPTDDYTGDISTLRNFAFDYIKPELDRIDGVGSTDVYGGREREVRIDVDPGTLAARGLTLSQVRDALRQQNANISAGTRTQGKRDFAVRTVGQYESVDQIRNTVIAYVGDAPIYVRDVATVESSYKRRGSFVRSRGRFTLAFPVRREVGRNVMKVMEGVRAAVVRINEEILQPRGLELEMVQSYDETVYITQSINTVRNNILFGGTLAAIVLMLFLRNIRATAVVVLSIPISVVGTFLVVAMLGRTINVISLAGMAFAVGMVVDSAVVVLENIYRHRQLGRNVFQATLAGTREVWGAVLASTLTTVAVFLPVIFVREEAGQLFRDISLATVAAVSLSLLVALTVIPVLASRLLAGGRPPQVDQTDRSLLGRFFAGLAGRLAGSPLARILVIIVMLVGSFGLIPWLVPPTTYLPSGNRNLIFGGLSAPPGYALDEYQRMGTVVEAVLKPYWEAEPGSPEAAELARQWTAEIEPLIEAGALPGTEPLPAPENWYDRLRVSRWLESLRIDRSRREWRTPPPPMSNFFYVAFGNTCFMGATSADDARVAPLARLLDRSIKDLPGIFGGFRQTSLFRLGGGNDVTVEVRGADIDKVRAAAEALQMACMQRFQSFPMATPANFALGRPELRIVPDRERAADVGLGVREIGQAVEACVDGNYVGDFRTEDDKRIDIGLYIAGQRERDLEAIGGIPLYTPIGRVVPLSSVARMVDTTAPEQIIRIERERAVSLSVQPPDAMALEQAVAIIQGEIEQGLRESGQIDRSITLAMTGNADKLTTARATMVGTWDPDDIWLSLYNIISSRFFLSVLVIYLLMAALYESWVIPLVIMFSVPLALFGGFLGLSIAHVGTLLSTSQPVQQLDVLTFLGFVILVGIVVNNAILLVNQALLHLREQGMGPTEAIREAVRVRVRPVFMTTLTTFVGQLPLALMAGAGTELYRGLASVMLGGLLIATIGTLILVPCVLAVVFSIPGMPARLARARMGTEAATTDTTPDLAEPVL